MKRIVALFVLLLVLCGCGSGDDKFVGTWRDGKYAQELVIKEGGVAYMVYDSSGTGETYDWTSKGDTITLKTTVAGMSYTLVYKLENGKLVSDIPGSNDLPLSKVD